MNKRYKAHKTSGKASYKVSRKRSRKMSSKASRKVSRKTSRKVVRKVSRKRSRKMSSKVSRKRSHKRSRKRSRKVSRKVVRKVSHNRSRKVSSKRYRKVMSHITGKSKKILSNSTVATNIAIAGGLVIGIPAVAAGLFALYKYRKNKNKTKKDIENDEIEKEIDILDAKIKDYLLIYDNIKKGSKKYELYVTINNKITELNGKLLEELHNIDIEDTKDIKKNKLENVIVKFKKKLKQKRTAEGGGAAGTSVVTK